MQEENSFSGFLLIQKYHGYDISTCQKFPQRLFCEDLCPFGTEEQRQKVNIRFPKCERHGYFGGEGRINHFIYPLKFPIPLI